MVLRRAWRLMTRQLWRTVMMALLPAAALAGGCEGGHAAAGPTAGGKGNPAAAPPAPVTVATATREDVPAQIGAIGWVEASESVIVKPQVEGQITEIHFAEGDRVKAGDLLFKIDERPFVAALKLAEATLAKSQALARDAASEAKRMKGLFEASTAAEREWEQAQANADATEAQVNADRAAVENAKLRLAYCTIRSPIAGRTGAKLVDVGNIVKANETQLVVINKLNPILVSFSVAEKHLALIKKHMQAGPLPVTAHIAGDTGPAERGTLTFIDNRVDETTGMIRLKGTFANDDNRLWPGQFVNVSLTITMQSGVTVVPDPAIQAGPTGQFVFVVKPDQTVELRPVTAGESVAGKTVVGQGLQPGEVVVTDGQLRLVPGGRVQIKNATPTSSRAAKP